MKAEKLFLMAVIMWCGGERLLSQDLHFSQFMMTPLHLDPSLAGKFGGDYRGILNHRSQWRSVTRYPYETYGGMFDKRFNQKMRKKNFFGGGLGVYTDKAGAGFLRTTEVNMAVAYHIEAGEGQYLSAGLEGWVLQRSVNVDNLRFDNQFDGRGHNAALPHGEDFSMLNLMKPSVSVGISYTFVDNMSRQVISDNGFQGKKMTVGMAAHYVNAPSYNFIRGIEKDRLGWRYVLHTSNSFGIPDVNAAVQPSGFLMMQRKAVDAVIGSYFRFTLREQSKYTQLVRGSAVSFGGHYRWGDAVIAGVVIEMGSFSVGFSYDINTSGLKSSSDGRGAYEISLRYVSPNPFMARSHARFN